MSKVGVLVATALVGSGLDHSIQLDDAVQLVQATGLGVSVTTVYRVLPTTSRAKLPSIQSQREYVAWSVHVARRFTESPHAVELCECDVIHVFATGPTPFLVQLGRALRALPQRIRVWCRHPNASWEIIPESSHRGRYDYFTLSDFPDLPNEKLLNAYVSHSMRLECLPAQTFQFYADICSRHLLKHSGVRAELHEAVQEFCDRIKASQVDRVNLYILGPFASALLIGLCWRDSSDLRVAEWREWHEKGRWDQVVKTFAVD